ncbi:glycoside hydrolase family 88/105 protein [Paenibacillus sp. LPE1-1-1.1]|uniref:glycoside hydrolase family 88/105 protein n=1 Tax=Paenibacillus sp. LPE1-1-1.1 TaxID=3135230 RepID=UPI0039C93848
MSLKKHAENVWNEMKRDYAGNWGMDIHKWDWVPGVGVIGLLDYYETIGDPAIISFLVEWAARNKMTTEAELVINAIAPFAIFPALYQVSGDNGFKEEAARVAKWLMEEAPRTREQAFEHTVTENVEFSEQVWADTVFMAVLFLARTASLLENEAYAQEAQKQMLLHLTLLEDRESGVLFHGWNCSTADHMSAARWTRANAWIAAGVPMILKEIAPLVQVSEELLARYRRLMDGLVRFQREDGLWSTVLDQPDYYREVSGSAGIAYGLWKAVDGGWLLPEQRYETAARRALKAIISNIGEDGIVAGVSGGTPVMESVEAYNAIPTYPTLYGQGLVLMLLSEALWRGESSHE